MEATRIRRNPKNVGQEESYGVKDSFSILGSNNYY